MLDGYALVPRSRFFQPISWKITALVPRHSLIAYKMIANASDLYYQRGNKRVGNLKVVASVECTLHQ